MYSVQTIKKIIEITIAASREDKVPVKRKSVMQGKIGAIIKPGEQFFFESEGGLTFKCTLHTGYDTFYSDFKTGNSIVMMCQFCDYDFETFVVMEDTPKNDVLCRQAVKEYNMSLKDIRDNEKKEKVESKNPDLRFSTLPDRLKTSAKSQLNGKHYNNPFGNNIYFRTSEEYREYFRVCKDTYPVTTQNILEVYFSSPETKSSSEKIKKILSINTSYESEKINRSDLEKALSEKVGGLEEVKASIYDSFSNMIISKSPCKILLIGPNGCRKRAYCRNNRRASPKARNYRSLLHIHDFD